MTRGSFWPILAAMLVGLAPFVVAAIVVSAGSLYYAAAESDGAGAILETVASNFVSAAYSVFSTALGVAVYWSRRVDRRGLSEVFA